MEQELERSYSFTLRGAKAVFNTVENLQFESQDAKMIYRTLRDQLQVVPFSDYLKRYIFLKTGMFGSYRNVSAEDYQATLVDAFRETGTPPSMSHLESRVSIQVKRWLQQISVRREVILLLGFGLSMPSEDVNNFLTCAIHERRLDPDDPLDAICLYCYEHHYGFYKMRRLLELYEQAAAGESEPFPRTVSPEERDLLDRLALHGRPGGTTVLREQTDYSFCRLYHQVGKLLRKGRSPSVPSLSRFPEGTDEEISPHEIENVICASIPRDRHGNLISISQSVLRKQLAGKRFSRQHLHEVVHGIIEPSRYDLITLQFLLFACQAEKWPDAKQRYLLFLEEINRILTDCGFGKMYTADPYDCLILMCLLSLDPLGTYGDVMELSYHETRLTKENEESSE